MYSAPIGHVSGNGFRSSPGFKRPLDHQQSYISNEVLKRNAVLDDMLSFLSPKNEIDVVDVDTGVTQLIKACENNSPSDVKILLDQGAGVNATDDSGRSPLMVASAEGNVEILLILLEFKSVVKSGKKLISAGSADFDGEDNSDSNEGDRGRSSSFMEKLRSKPSPKLNSEHATDKRQLRDNAAPPTAESAEHNAEGVDHSDGGDAGVNRDSQADDAIDDDHHSVVSEVDCDPEDTFSKPSPATRDCKPPPRRMSLVKLKNLLKPSVSGEYDRPNDEKLPDIDVEAKDKYGWTALMYGALCGNEEVVRVLIEHDADIHAVNVKHRTALHIAVTYCRLNVAALLLKCGADINRLDMHEWTPAMAACKRGEIEAVDFALERGAFLSINMHTLLTVSATYGHLDLVINLLERKVKPSLGLRDIENERVLTCAAEHRHIQIVQFMLEFGVSVNATNEYKQNALLLACLKGHEEIINFLMQHQDVDIFQEDSFGFTSFLYVASNNLIQVIKLLISRGVKVNSASSKSGIQALMCAAKAGHFKLVTLLLDQFGAFIDATDYSKKSALHYSCIGGHSEIADLLIAKGAKYKKDSFNRTPLYYARSNGHFEVAATLEHKYGDKKILMRADLQPVASCFDITFLTLTATACYADIAFDIINAYTFYKQKQFKFFYLALFFQVIPICASVTLQKGWGTKCMAVLHLSVIREFYHSIRGKVETPMMCTLRIIETCLEACPSALLQLYVLVSSWLRNYETTHSARGFYGFLPSFQEQLLFLSILISIGSTSITFIKFVSSEKDRLLMPVKSILNCFVDAQEKLSNIEAVYCYHCCEEFFRLLTLAVLFIALQEWALLAIAVSYVLRMIIVIFVHKAESFTECNQTRQYVKVVLRIALAQMTDCLWFNNFKLTLNLQILTTLEGLGCSLFFLYIDGSDTIFSFDRIQLVLIVGGMTWVLKTVLYLLTYFWMCSETSAVVIVDDDDFGLYFSSSRNLRDMAGVVDAAVSMNEKLEKSKGAEEYESHAVADRKNYFSSIMRGVNKARAIKFEYDYSMFPQAFPSDVISLLKSIKHETISKKIGLKRGLADLQHNEDFHLLFPQFFHAVKTIAPRSLENMIRSTLAEARRKGGRVVRSPFRLLFNLFLRLQSAGVLLPMHSRVPRAASIGAGEVFPDRVDWVEFLDFVSKVDLEELENVRGCAGLTEAGAGAAQWRRDDCPA